MALWFFRKSPRTVNHSQNINLIDLDTVDEAVRWLDDFADVRIIILRHPPARLGKNRDLFVTADNFVGHSLGI